MTSLSPHRACIWRFRAKHSEYFNVVALAVPYLVSSFATVGTRIRSDSNASALPASSSWHRCTSWHNDTMRETRSRVVSLVGPSRFSSLLCAFRNFAMVSVYSSYDWGSGSETRIAFKSSKLNSCQLSPLPWFGSGHVQPGQCAASAACWVKAGGVESSLTFEVEGWYSKPNLAALTPTHHKRRLPLSGLEPVWEFVTRCCATSLVREAIPGWGTEVALARFFFNPHALILSFHVFSLFESVSRSSHCAWELHTRLWNYVIPQWSSSLLREGFLDHSKAFWELAVLNPTAHHSYDDDDGLWLFAAWLIPYFGSSTGERFEKPGKGRM